MFKWGKSLDVVTLFHKSSSPASQKVLELLKQTSVAASEQATAKATSDKASEQAPSTPEFELDVVEEAPTTDQLSSILKYVGPSNIGKVIKGAQDTSNAMKIFRSDAHSFQRPVTVTWETGKAVVGDNSSEILNLVAALPKNK